MNAKSDKRKKYLVDFLIFVNVLLGLLLYEQVQSISIDVSHHELVVFYSSCKSPYENVTKKWWKNGKEKQKWIENKAMGEGWHCLFQASEQC